MGYTKRNVGGMWISHCPIVFINTGERKERRCGQHVDIMLPHCLRQRLGEEEKENMGGVWISCCPVVFGGEQRKMWAVCGLHTAPSLLLTLREAHTLPHRRLGEK